MLDELGNEFFEDQWPDPSSLQAELPRVPEFNPDWLPAPLRPLVEETSLSMQTPPDYAGAAMIVALAGVVGRRALMRPKCLDESWAEACNLWGANVGMPGLLKSPVLERITSPLVRIEAEWEGLRQAEMAVYEAARRDIELEQQVFEGLCKAAIRDGRPRPPRPDATIYEPHQRRLLVTDATQETLHLIQSKNEAGVLCTRDELSGFLASLDREGREAERPYWLQCWSGSGHHTLDCITRGQRIFVRNTCASLFGNLTPTGAARLVKAVADGNGDDGLLQRFGVLVWPDVPKDWRWIDRRNGTSAAAWERIARALVRLSPTDPLQMNFEPTAQELFIGWYGELQARLRSDALHAAMQSHLSKYSKLVPVCAALFELAELADRGALECRAAVEEPYSHRVRRIRLHDPVAPSSMPAPPSDATPVKMDNLARAISLSDYLEQHANRLYSCVITPKIRAAHALARHLRRNDLGRSFSKHDIVRRCWGDLQEEELIDAALKHLSELVWIREIEIAKSPKGGRPPSSRFAVNPKVLHHGETSE